MHLYSELVTKVKDFDEKKINKIIKWCKMAFVQFRLSYHMQKIFFKIFERLRDTLKTLYHSININE